MAAIIGVHGIMNQQLGRHQLITTWGPALADGLERAAGHPVPPIRDLDIAFYGDLFLADQAKAGSKGKGGGPAEFTEDDADALGPFVAEVAGAFASSQPEAEEPPSKGLPPAPRSVQWLLRALDQRFGSRTASLLFLGELKQVRRYLVDPDLKAAADYRAMQVIARDGRVVIGHSLGSVVAFEFVRQHPDYQVDLLLTLGSPLGLHTVRALMPTPDYGAERIPPNVTRWVNVRDPRDPVACAGALTGCWPGITDHTVDNQGDAHSVIRYLGKWRTGAAVLAALPDLADTVP